MRRLNVPIDEKTHRMIGVVAAAQGVSKTQWIAHTLTAMAQDHYLQVDLQVNQSRDTPAAPEAHGGRRSARAGK